MGIQMYSLVTIVNNTVLHIWKLLREWNFSSQKKIFVTYYDMNVKIYCGDHFIMYTNIKSLCWTVEINIMLYMSIIFQVKNK